MNNYSPLSKLLHKIILKYPIVGKTAFDLNCLLNPSAKKINIEKPVYISGLARSGTTLLLNILYDSNNFNSLTYRNMPLVLAPQIWNKIFSSRAVSQNRKERAHKDNVYINLDSPEAFDEIFWLTFENEKIKNNELLEKYVKFVKNVISNDVNTSLRYLSKNNNISRVPQIINTFSDAIILIPFRNPEDHAASLLKQHIEFIKKQQNDTFVLSYMSWLGHFEFGLNFKPLKVVENIKLNNFNESLNINFWLKYWIETHIYILNNLNKNTTLIDYDNLCDKPKESLTHIEKITFLKSNSLVKSNKYIRAVKNHQSKNLNLKLLNKAKDIHYLLKKNSKQF